MSEICIHWKTQAEVDGTEASEHVTGPYTGLGSTCAHGLLMVDVVSLHPWATCSTGYNRQREGLGLRIRDASRMGMQLRGWLISTSTTMNALQSESAVM